MYNGYGEFGTQFMTVMLSIFVIILMSWLVIGSAAYILKSFGMYTIARRQGRDNPWLAWIPFARTYLHGELAGRITLKKKTINKPGIWLLVLPYVVSVILMIFGGIMEVAMMSVIMSSFSFFAAGYAYSGGYSGAITVLIIMYVIVLLVSLVCGAVLQVLRILINFQIFRKFTSRNMAIVHGVFCSLIPLYEAISLFVIRNHEYEDQHECRCPQPDVPPVYQEQAEPPVPVYSEQPEPAVSAEPSVTAEAPADDDSEK